jgi:hypothetical protein
MAKQTINNGDQLLSVRTKINENFDEVYTDKLTPTEVATLRTFLQYWTVDANGNLLPVTTASVDIGAADKKVRDIFEDGV